MKLSGDLRNARFARSCELARRLTLALRTPTRIISLTDSANDPTRFEIAPQWRLQAVEHLAPEFFKRIFDRDEGDFAWTDESFLSDFDVESSDQEIYQRISEVYGVDVSSIEPPFVVDVLLLIQCAQP